MIKLSKKNKVISKFKNHKLQKILWNKKSNLIWIKAKFFIHNIMKIKYNQEKQILDVKNKIKIEIIINIILVYIIIIEL